MITEDYVSFETAKLLKEKGFDEPTVFRYGDYPDNDDLLFAPSGMAIVKNSETQPYFYSAPTLQMAMKWLREKHNKTIITGIKVTDPITGIIDYYYNGIYYVPKNNGGALCFTSPTPENGYSTYEEDCEAAIKYCLENLIN